MRLVGLLLAAWRVLACLQDIQTLKQTSNTPQQHTKKDASPEEVPVIDMSAPAADAAARVRAACIDSGFFYVRDHGGSRACRAAEPASYWLDPPL